MKFEKLAVSAVVRRTESAETSRKHFVLFQLQQAGGEECVDGNMDSSKLVIIAHYHIHHKKRCPASTFTSWLCSSLNMLSS